MAGRLFVMMPAFATAAPEQHWKPGLMIVGGFLVGFPLIWCFVVWMLSRISGWHHLAATYASGDRAMTGTCQGGVTGMVGIVSYRGVLTVSLTPEGFFLEVMALFRIGQPRLFIPWSAVSARTPRSLLFWNAVTLGIGQPVMGTITLPAKVLEKQPPPPL